MNKKALKIAGWAMGLTLAVAGVGVAVANPIFANREAIATLAETTETITSDLTDSTEVAKWTCNDGGAYSSDKSRKLDGSGKNILRNGLFSDAVSLGMTSLTVTVEGKINGSDSADNQFKVEALDSAGAALASTTYKGTIGTSYSNHTFTISSGLAGTTGIKITYLDKASGNWAIKTVKWSATYSSTSPIVNWEASYHPSEGYTEVPYTFAATSLNITDPAWTWTVSPSAGVSIDDADEMAEITFANVGTYTVTAYAEASADSSVHAQAEQEIVISESASTLTLSQSSLKLAPSKSATVTPTVVNVGKYTDTEVSVSITSGSELVTVTGLTDGKVESGSAVTISAKESEGVAVLSFSNNGNTEELTVEIANTKTIVYGFTDKDLAYSSVGSDDVSSYTSASWSTDVAANSYESTSPSRGVQFGAAKGDINVTLSASAAMKDYSVTRVELVVSSNGTGNTIGVSVGGSDFMSGEEKLISTNGLANSLVAFDGNGCGDLVIAISDTHKSVYVKSVTLTIELNASVVSKFINNYLHMDEYVDDETYSETRCNANWSAASAAYAKLNNAQQALFVGGDYADAAARFGAWAAANGASFDSDTGVLSANRVGAMMNSFGKSSNSIIAIAAVIAVGVLTTGALVFGLRKRKAK